MTFKLCLCYLDDTGVTPGEVDLADYTRSIERLNTSLGFLQTEMQRLAQQQERIMAMKEQQHQAWVIPPPAPSPHRCQIMSYTSPDVEIKPQSFTLASYLSRLMFFFTGSSVSCAAAASQAEARWGLCLPTCPRLALPALSIDPLLALSGGQPRFTPGHLGIHDRMI